MAISLANASEVHSQALQRFVCATPSKETYEAHRGRYHPAPWELEVQSRLRGQRLPRPDGEAMYLALDDGEVAGAVWLAFDGPQGDMRLMAVAVGCRWQGRGLGGRLLDVGVEAMTATKREYNLDCGAFAYVHPENTRSQALFSARGWEQLNDYDGYQGWVHEL